MITVDLNQIVTISAEEAYLLTGCPAEDFNEPGTYYVVIGSRGEIEELEFLGDEDSIEIPTLEEVCENTVDDETRSYYKQFYGLGVEDDHINFGYYEEGYNVWLKIA